MVVAFIVADLVLVYLQERFIAITMGFKRVEFDSLVLF